MPEGPEVSFMCNLLNKEYKGSILEKLEIKSGRYIRHGIPENIKHLKKDLPLKIKKFSNHGKLLYFELSNDKYLTITLGMTGHILFYEEKHTHYHFITNKGTFYLEDMRNFATINYITKTELEKKLASLGPDLIHDEVSNDLFIERIRLYPNKPIGQVLLDQKVVAGVGNYLRADALYIAKISPFRLIQQLSDNELIKLKKSLQKIMKWALKSHIQHKYMRSYVFLVYGRVLTKKKEEIVAQKMGDRTIYWVPSVQK